MRKVWKRLLVQLLAVALCGCGWACPAKSDAIYWSEYTSGFGAIYRLDVATGNVSTFVTGTGYGAGGNHIDYPQALTLDKAGNVYVGNANNGDIVKVTPQGVASDYFAVADPTHYPHTYGLTFDPSGNLYVAMAAQNSVAILPPGGTETVFASGLDRPQGGVSDADGNVYVYTSAGPSGTTVTKITPTGAVSTFANGVIGVLWDRAGDLYTAAGDHVTITSPSGGVSTLVSGLTRPFPIGLGAQGDLYVYDGGANDALLKVSPSGAVTTLAHLPNALAFATDVPEPSLVLITVPVLLLLIGRAPLALLRAPRATLRL